MSKKFRKFRSGALRADDTGRPRPDLISPYFQMRLGGHLVTGAKGFPPRNWERGMPISEYAKSACRHLAQWRMGLTNEDHLAALAFNVMCAIDHEERIKLGLLPKELDDMPRNEKGSLCDG